MENSSFGRLIGVLVSPGKTFRSIAERPTWGVALVVFMLVHDRHGHGDLARQADISEAMRRANGGSGPGDACPGAEGGEGIMRARGNRPRGLVPAVIVPGARRPDLSGLQPAGRSTDVPDQPVGGAPSAMPAGLVSALLVHPGHPDRGRSPRKRSRPAGFSSRAWPSSLRRALGPGSSHALQRRLLLALGRRTVDPRLPFAARVSKATAAAVVIGLWLLGSAARSAWRRLNQDAREVS